VTVQNRIFFTYLYLDNTTGMTHLKIMAHVNNLFTFFLSQLITSNFSLVLIFRLDCIRWRRFMFLTYVGKKLQSCRRGN